tara:strand:- start:523 stop:738 length:216 start_codon:yes stop_codon:yes gene_type:complete
MRTDSAAGSVRGNEYTRRARLRVSARLRRMNVHFRCCFAPPRSENPFKLLSFFLFLKPNCMQTSQALIQRS